MNLLKISCVVVFICFWATTVHADIYYWTDKNGVVHFTNYSPPPQGKIFIKSTVTPRDMSADDGRLKAGEEPKPAQHERELELEEKLLEANRKLGEAQRYATVLAEEYIEKTADLEESLIEAERRAEEAEDAQVSAERPSAAGLYPYSGISVVFPYRYRHLPKRHSSLYYKRHLRKHHFKKPYGFDYERSLNTHHFRGRLHSGLEHRPHSLTSNLKEYRPGGIRHKRHLGKQNFGQHRDSFHYRGRSIGRHLRR